MNTSTRAEIPCQKLEPFDAEFSGNRRGRLLGKKYGGDYEKILSYLRYNRVSQFRGHGLRRGKIQARSFKLWNSRTGQARSACPCRYSGARRLSSLVTQAFNALTHLAL